MKKIHGAGTAAAKGQKTAGSEDCRKHSSGRRLLCVLLMGAVLAGCAGPSTRVIVRSETGSNHELPEEIPVLEEVNPYYIQESLTVLSETSRYGGSRGERDAVKYIQQLLGDYGYQVEIQRFRYETEFGVRTGTNVEAVREASSRDSDILVICSNHDTAKESPGANNNGSGTAAFLETARLLSRIPTDTELRFVSFAQCGRERLGARHYVESLRKTEFTSETAGVERICCIDDNEEALLWRLRMIGTAKESIVLSTFDLRADDNGTKILAALNCAAARGVKIQLLIDGIYQQLFLAGSSDFQALASYENVEVGVYNPVTPVNLFKVNYRMHDKYLIVDEKMYLLGGRNSNDIFLGDQTKGINEDRDILVYDTSEGQGESLNQLEDYFHKIWKESCVSIKKGKQSSRYTDAYRHMEEIYISLLKRYNDIETYSAWEKDTIEANKITLINNGIEAGRKTPQVLQTIQYLTENADHVIIQTPYVICNGYMYDVLQGISDHAKLQIVLNAVEKGSNPWGCTDYLNQKKKILETGADVYELMNDYPVHTKAVLINDRLSVVGSYNLDMRSTYLDTELMLVIDSEKLSQQIHETESDYMEKSKEVLANGQETEGAKYQGKVLNRKKKLYYGVLRIIIRPLRQLL